MSWRRGLALSCLAVAAGQGFYDPFCDTCAELPDHLGTLGLQRPVNRTAVKKACRELKVKYHPDKNLGRAKEVAGRFEAVSDACEELGEKNQQLFTEYIRMLDLCDQCAESFRGPGADSSSTMGGDFMSESTRMAYEMAFGPGVTQEEQYFTRGGVNMKREIVCHANAYERACHAVEYEQIGSEWVVNPMGWYEWTPEDQHGASRGEGTSEEARLYDPVLMQGEFLRNGGTVTSSDGSHFAIMMLDGNFAIFEGSGPRSPGRKIWETESYTTHPESFVVLQNDGNLVVRTVPSGWDLYDVSSLGDVLWSSNRRIEALPGSGAVVVAVLQNDGNLVVSAQSPDGSSDCVWASIACPEEDFLEDPVGSVRLLRNQLRLSVRRAFPWFTEAPGEARRSGSRGIQWLLSLTQSLWRSIRRGRHRGA